MLQMMNYIGPSMNPVLKSGDGMVVVPYGNEEVRAGDVIVFRHPKNNHKVVHRVASVNPQGVKTRGDNNDLMDPWRLQPGDITGRVIFVKRNQKNVTIHGGQWGRILACVNSEIKSADVGSGVQRCVADSQ